MGTREQLKRRTGGGTVVVAVGALALAMGVLAACGGTPAPSGPAGTPNPATGAPIAPTVTRTVTRTVTPTGAISTSPSSTGPTSTSPSASATPTYLTSVPVYFVGESQGSVKLFREFRTIRKIDGPISSAVSAMTRLAPLDPDYVNPWRSASRVWVTGDAATLRVDVSADAFRNTNVGSELASVAIQQLVYTALAASESTGSDAQSVVITVGGERYDAWGVVHLEGRWQRAPMIDVQAPAWITSPQEGDRLPAGTVRFTGYGTSFEGTFHWTVTTSGGKVVAHASAMGGSMGTFGAVRFAATLQPGSYLVKLATDDPSGGEGHGVATDTKHFTVR